MDESKEREEHREQMQVFWHEGRFYFVDEEHGVYRNLMKASDTIPIGQLPWLERLMESQKQDAVEGSA